MSFQFTHFLRRYYKASQIRIREALSMAIVALALTACASLDINDPKSVSDLVKTKHDNFQKTTYYEGPSFLGGFIRAYKSDVTGSIDYQAYISKGYVDEHWHFYDSAYDSNGNKLNVTLIDRSVSHCSRGTCLYYEDLAVNVTRAYLINHQESGMRFKISGKLEGVDEIVFIPGGYIRGFLSVAK